MGRHSLKASSSPIYSNCAGYSKTGELMFRCRLRKMRWYLERGLAEKIADDPPAIRLLFDAKGTGHQGDPFFLAPRRNECVVCGTADNLTRHHVLPHCYRRWFPKVLDRYGPYDVFALCTEHHESYELRSDEFREKLAREYDAPVGGIGGSACPTTGAAVQAAYALMRYSDQIPEARKTELRQHVIDHFGVDDPTLEFLREQVRKNRTVCKTHGQIVVKQLEDYDQIGKFVIRWREHFLKTMSPKFLPDHWDVERVFYPEAQ